MKRTKLVVLPGDGIGAEVTHAALPIFEYFDLPIDLHVHPFGFNCFLEEGKAIPSSTWKAVLEADLILVGAATSKPSWEMDGRPYRSPILQLRQDLDLFANVRPCFNILPSHKSYRFCIIRENTQGLYAGLDYYPLPEAMVSLMKDTAFEKLSLDDMAGTLRIQTRAGLTRIFHYAFQYAKAHGFSRVTFADKPNVLRKSAAFARDIFETIAKEYSEITADIENVDSIALWLIRRPEQFGVIVTENMFGDILSDVGAATMGGLGLAPSANIGEHRAYFEPVHGSGLKMKPHTANPAAMFLTIVLVLEHLQYFVEASRLKEAVLQVIVANKKVTYDLGGNSSTESMAFEIISTYRHLEQYGS